MKATPAKEKKANILADNALATPAVVDAKADISPLATRSSRKLRKSVSATTPAKALENEAKSFVTFSSKQRQGVNIGTESIVRNKDADENQASLSTNNEEPELLSLMPPLPATSPATERRKKSNLINMRQISAEKPDTNQDVVMKNQASSTGSSLHPKSPPKTVKKKQRQSLDAQDEVKSDDGGVIASTIPNAVINTEDVQKPTAEKSENVSVTEEVAKETEAPVISSRSPTRSPPKSTKKNTVKSFDVAVEHKHDEGESSPSTNLNKVAKVDPEHVTLVQWPTAEMSKNAQTTRRTEAPLILSPLPSESPLKSEKKKKKKHQQRKSCGAQMEHTAKDGKESPSPAPKKEFFKEVEFEGSTLSEQPLGSAKEEKKFTETSTGADCSPRRSDARSMGQDSKEHSPLALLGKAETTKIAKGKKKRKKSLDRGQLVEDCKSPIQNDELEEKSVRAFFDDKKSNSECVVNPDEKVKRRKMRRKRTKTDVTDTAREYSNNNGTESDLTPRNKAGEGYDTAPIEKLRKRKRKRTKSTSQGALSLGTPSPSSDAAQLVTARESTTLTQSEMTKTNTASLDNYVVDQKPASERTGDPTKLNQSDSAKKRIQSMITGADSYPIGNSDRVIDVSVHRMRFLKLNLKSIIAMASTPWRPRRLRSGGGQHVEQLWNVHSQRLAISREGGSVELLNSKERWISLGYVPGVRGREVDGLVWVCSNNNPDFITVQKRSLESSKLNMIDQHELIRYEDEERRLIGCSRDGTIFELDFATKRQKNVIGSGGGGVFCLSSLYSRGNCDSESAGCFAAGCEDGSVKLYRISGEEDGKCSSGLPHLISTLPSAGNAVLSLAWLPGHRGGIGGSVIFAGVADGTIRRFDCNTAVVTGPISTGTILSTSTSSSISHRWRSTLRMTVENRGLREATRVWALEALSDGTVISGDSLGHVQVWDGLSGTMSQTFNHNESGADVLCLAISEDENKVFASGVDSRVICIERQQENAFKSNSNTTSFEPGVMRKWINTGALRQHTHDVKALAVCHKDVRNSSDYLELIVSGGVDTKLCTYIAKDFRSCRPKIWYNWPMLSPVSISRERRLLSVARAKHIDIYQLDCSFDAKSQSGLTPMVKDETKCHIKTISIQSSFNLNCATISDDGNFLAASDAASTYLFSLGIEDKNGVIDLHPTKLNLPLGSKGSSVALKFDGQKRLFCATTDGSILVLGIPSTSNEKVTLEHVFKDQSFTVPSKSHHFPFVFLDITSDGNWLAAGRFSSGKGAVHIFALPSSEVATYQHWWSVPEMEASVNCIKLLGGGSAESSLAVGCSNNTFYIFNVIRRSLSDFSHEMGLPIQSSLPKELTSRPEPIKAIISNPSNLYKFILVSHF